MRGVAKAHLLDGAHDAGRNHVALHDAACRGRGGWCFGQPEAGSSDSTARGFAGPSSVQEVVATLKHRCKARCMQPAASQPTMLCCTRSHLCASPTKDVDQDGLDLWVAGEDVEGVHHLGGERG